MNYARGQRWISETEPELGLGTILEVSERQVRIVFPGSEDLRCYAADSAPIRRVAFQVGDTVLARDGTRILVDSLEVEQGCIIYHGEGQRLPEGDLSDAISFDKPDDRLRRGQLDSTHLFDLRAEALRHQHERRKSRVRGFVGGRVDLIKHQFYIAHNVANRYAPRVLLADEVGLGKTIEAGLILHRLLLSGRASRVLILVPESLVHQWFVEMYRRFNLWFNIFDEERCQAIAENNPDANPFLDDQLVLASIDFLTRQPNRLKQALNAGWDVLCVDEAHHLGWSPKQASPEYEVVDALGRATPALLLLTATPEQLGQASHFARLRLLDPDRYFDLYTFLQEASDYRAVAEIADKLLRGDALDGGDEAELMSIFVGQEDDIRARLPAVASDPKVRRLLLDDLLDQHGTGRVMYRNTRSAITGFPSRQLHRVVLEGPESLGAIAAEFAHENGMSRTRPAYEYAADPRLAWLEGLLRKMAGEKLLLICRAKAKALAIEEALRARINVKTAVFHEGLSLLQRDRNAAWFGERDGAQLLICSEIGSEGRNFQFAHHLVLFDLPLNPELLEQRIGRLDRIGQTTDINIHLPVVEGSCEAVLGAWLHDGLDAIEHNLHGSFAAQERFGDRVEQLAATFHSQPDEDALATLVEESREFRIALLDKLEHGRDRLLELNSYRPPVAKSLVAEIAALDAQEDLDNFMLALWDHYGFTVEDLSNRSYLLRAEHTFTDALPSIPRDGLMLTFERRRALSREDISFLSWDHPVVTGALDLMLSAEHGNASFAIWPADENKGLLLEAIFLIDCVAPAHLHIDRFLPPTPLRLILNHQLAEFAEELPEKLIDAPPSSPFLEQPPIAQVLLPKMIERMRAIAEERTPQVIADAEAAMHAVLDHEVDRLRLLQRVNDHVRDDEIRIAEEQAAALHAHIANARPRLDAVRLIWHGKPASVLG
jgi:ATP-dependent helicase HepA